MKLPEDMQIDISALIDGECDADRLLPLIDHLVQHEEGREYYRSIRRLHRAVCAESALEFSEPLPERLWRSIRQRSGLVPAAGSWSWPRPTFAPAWALAAAAVFLVVLAFWDTPPSTDPGQSGRVRPGVHIELDVGQDPNRMSDERFVSLTAELLRADSRYHRKMLEVMSEVDRFGFDGEGSAEGRRSPDESSRGEGRLDERAFLP